MKLVYRMLDNRAWLKNLTLLLRLYTLCGSSLDATYGFQSEAINVRTVRMSSVEAVTDDDVECESASQTAL
jgi:hypothetical protein